MNTVVGTSVCAVTVSDISTEKSVGWFELDYVMDNLFVGRDGICSVRYWM